MTILKITDRHAGAQPWSTAMHSRPNLDFPVGTRVRDRETGDLGYVVHVFKTPAFEGVVAVLWNGDDTPVAVHIEDLERRS
jgi:hypothetical protein